MAIVTKLEGVEKVLENLRRQQKVIGENVAKGCKLAGLMLQRESQQLVPVDLGNLKASAFTRAEGSGWETVVSVGYTAFYALYVHEAVAMKLKGVPRASGRGLHWDPQGRAQAKFLEEPARRMAPELRKIIRNSALIK